MADGGLKYGPSRSRPASSQGPATLLDQVHRHLVSSQVELHNCAYLCKMSLYQALRSSAKAAASRGVRSFFSAPPIRQPPYAWTPMPVVTEPFVSAYIASIMESLTL